MTEVNGEVKKEATVKVFSKKRKPHIAAIRPFQNRYQPESKNTQKGIWNYGNDNKLPNKLLAWVLDSGTAKLAQAKRATYTAADGFQDDDAAVFKVNAKQTADDILSEIAGYTSYFKGFALLVKRNMTNTEVSVTCLPFQDIRKKLDGNFIYNPTLSSTKYESNKDQTIPAYAGPRALTAEEFAERQQCGEILYVYKASADNAHYPIPIYYAGIEDIRTSSELQKFDFETVMNAFITSAILTIIGNTDDTVKDENGMTARDYLDEQLEQFTGNSKDANGVSGRNSLLVIPVATKDEAPILQAFDSKVIMEASNGKRDIIDRAVSRLFEVNPALIGFADAAILGNQQALANASDELSKNVWHDQQMISAAFKMLWPNQDWTITSFRPIQYIPDSLLTELTSAERRALIGYPELQSDTTGDVKILAETLGVGGTQSLTTVLTDQLIANPQKVEILKIVFGLTQEQANSLVYGNETGATA